MEEGTTTLTFPETLADEESRGRQGPIVVVTAIPAELCHPCAESVIDSETVDQLNELVKDALFLYHRFPDPLHAEGVSLG